MTDLCPTCNERPARENGSECFHCHVKGIGFGFRGSATPTRAGWNRTAREWREEHFGTNDERELAKRGIERVSS